MPTSDNGATAVLLDTSAAVAFVLPTHEGHAAAVARLLRVPKGLAGHAVFETYSVLTRLPPPHRLGPASAVRLITTNFPASVHPTRGDAGAALAELSNAGLAGGSVYDGLVALAARAAGRLLVSADRRAAATYQLLGIDYELLSGD